MSVYRNSAYYLLSTILAKISPFFLLPILTTALPPSEFGLASIYITTISVIGTFAGLGTQIVVPKYYHSQPFVEFRALFGALLVIVASSSAAVLVTAILLCLFYGPASWIYVIPITVAGIAAVINSMNLSWLRTTESVNKYMLFEVGFSACSFVLVFSCVKLFDASMANWVYPVVASYVLFGLIAVLHLFLTIRPKFVVLSDSLKSVLNLCLPLLPHSISLMIISVSDRYILNIMSSSTAVAYYVLAVNLAIVIKICSDSFMKAWNPFYFKNADDDALIKKYRLSFFIIIILASVIYYGTVLLFFEWFFPQDYSEAKKILPILLVSYLFFTAYQINVSKLINFNKTNILKRATPLAAVVNIAFNIILIPYWQAYAPAIATGIAYFFLAFYVHWRLKQELR
jgi:O-antigen/teichoic acid export membrane protein